MMNFLMNAVTNLILRPGPVAAMGATFEALAPMFLSYSLFGNATNLLI
jgi:hypothetical protein